MQLNRHELSAAWPDMSEDEFQALRDSIAASGLREPIVLYEGDVLDGWHRYLACRSEGMEIRTEQYAGDDPREYVRDKHTRRALAREACAVAIAKMHEWQPRGRPDKSANLAELTPVTTAAMAEQAGVSLRTMERVKELVAHGSDALVKAVQAGTVSVGRAAEFAKLPKDQQAQAVAAPPPPRAPKPPAAPAVQDPQAQHLAMLHEQVTFLSEELRAAREDVDSLTRIGEAGDKLAAALEEASKYRALARGLDKRIQSMTTEIAELKRSVSYWKDRAGATA